MQVSWSPPWMHSAASTGLGRNHFSRWMPGWLSSAGSGPHTSMPSNAISTVWIATATIHQPQRKEKLLRRRRRGPTANAIKEKQNENQIDQHICRRSEQGPAVLYRRTGFYQESRFQ